MKNIVTGLALLTLGLLWVPRAEAQITDVTIRQINALHADSLALLRNGGATMTEDEITRRVITNEFVSAGDTVRFGAVVLSNPLNSGLASPGDAGLPGRIHIYVRDTSSVAAGNEGMTIQIVDNNYQLYGTDALFVGDVIEMVAVVSQFSGEFQLSPASAPNVLGTYQDLGFPASIMDPVVVTTSDVNKSVGSSGEVQPYWDNYANLRGQYIRLEGVTVAERDLSSSRPGWYVTSDGGTTGMLIRDTSLRYRNDRSEYAENYNVREDDFVPPPPGSVINLQGFTALYDFDQFNHVTPMALYIVPFEDSDLEIVASPPIITNVTNPPVPGADVVPVTADVSADPTRTLATVELQYYTSTTTDTVTVAAGAPTGTNYPFEIPAAADGEFVTYWISATDNIGASSRSPDQQYRVLADGIDDIADIQTTPSGGEGPSPFAGATLPMNITAVVQTDGAGTGLWALQDSGDAPWSGIEVYSFKSTSPVPVLGDNVTVTEAVVNEAFSLTVLDSVVVTIDGAGTPIPHKIMTTDALQDPAIAEAHEGMLVRFDDVIIALADASFGEWTFYSASTTAENFVKGDDASTAIPDTFNVLTFADGASVTYIQGLLSYTFSEYKVFPGTASDVGDVETSVEEDVVVNAYRLSQNYPNPFTNETVITVTTPDAGPVRLAVYDVLGRHVSTLVDGVLPAGEHIVEFNRRGLASGLYLYRLEAGSTTIARSMTVVR